MANLLFEIFYQLDDSSHLNQAKKLAALGKMAKARKSLFEVFSSREERFGEKSPESIEVLLWIAEIHLQQAKAHLDFALILLCRMRDFDSSSQRFCNTYIYQHLYSSYRSINSAMNKELQSSHSVLRYAEREIEGARRKGELEIRIQIALFQIEDCLNCPPRNSKGVLDSRSSGTIRRERILRAFDQAETLLAHTPGYSELNCIEYLVDFVVLHCSQSSDSDCLIRAAELKAKAEEERALLIEYEAEVTLRARFA